MSRLWNTEGVAFRRIISQPSSSWIRVPTVGSVQFSAQFLVNFSDCNRTLRTGERPRAVLSPVRLLDRVIHGNARLVQPRGFVDHILERLMEVVKLLFRDRGGFSEAMSGDVNVGVDFLGSVESVEPVAGPCRTHRRENAI